MHKCQTERESEDKSVASPGRSTHELHIYIYIDDLRPLPSYSLSKRASGVDERARWVGWIDRWMDGWMDCVLGLNL
jgi:hypothetical protein